MNAETNLLIKLKYEQNEIIIKNKLVGYGVSKIENELLNTIAISEKLKLERPLDEFISALQSNTGVSSK